MGLRETGRKIFDSFTIERNIIERYRLQVIILCYFSPYVDLHLYTSYWYYSENCNLDDIGYNISFLSSVHKNLFSKIRLNLSFIGKAIPNPKLEKSSLYANL